MIKRRQFLWTAIAAGALQSLGVFPAWTQQNVEAAKAQLAGVNEKIATLTRLSQEADVLFADQVLSTISAFTLKFPEYANEANRIRGAETWKLFLTAKLVQKKQLEFQLSR